MPKSKNPLTPETAYAQAASRCATTEYCLSDWRKKFLAKGLTPAEAETVLNRLVDEGFINETRYARAFVHDKAHYDRWGALKIRQALALKRIPAEATEEALQEISREWWGNTLLDLLRQKRRSIKAASPFEERQKLLRFAAGRGFEPGLIYEAVNALCGEADDCGNGADSTFADDF